MSGWWPWSRKTFLESKLHPAVELVCDLLDLSSGWVRDDYHLTHRECGVSIWISNNCRFLDFAINGKPARLNDNNFVVDAHSKQHLVNHVKAYLDGVVSDRSSTEIAAFAERVTKRLIAEHNLPAESA